LGRLAPPIASPFAPSQKHQWPPTSEQPLASFLARLANEWFKYVFGRNLQCHTPTLRSGAMHAPGKRSGVDVRDDTKETRVDVTPEVSEARIGGARSKGLHGVHRTDDRFPVVPFVEDEIAGQQEPEL
jgi:hypothetical protein